MNESWKDNQNIIHEEARGSHPGLNIFSFSIMILRLLLCKDTELYLRFFCSLKKTFVCVWLFFLNSRNNSVLGKCPISKKKNVCIIQNSTCQITRGMIPWAPLITGLFQKYETNKKDHRINQKRT